jgi:succinyl-diaminopimelate desuccinylase
MMPADDVSRWAEEDHASVVALSQRLVRIPSRGGIDPYQPVLDTMRDWFTGADIANDLRLAPVLRSSD